MDIEDIKRCWEQQVCNKMKLKYKHLSHDELILLYRKQQEENIPSWIIKAPKSNIHI